MNTVVGDLDMDVVFGYCAGRLWPKPPAGTYITKARTPGDAAKLNSPMWRFRGGRRTHAAYF